MAEKVTTMLLKVDLQCSNCYRKVKKVLCKFPQIRDQMYDEKNNIVRINVVCCSPEKIRDKLCCKGGKTIKSIEIVEPPKPKPPQEKPKPPQEKPNPPQDKPKPPAEKPKETEKPKEVPKPDPTPTPKAPPPDPVHSHPPVPIGICCEPCYRGIPGGPCYEWYERPVSLPPPPPQPCYGGYGCGCGCGGYGLGYRYSRNCWCGCGGAYVRGCRCDQYFSDENASACTIM